MPPSQRGVLHLAQSADPGDAPARELARLAPRFLAPEAEAAPQAEAAPGAAPEGESASELLGSARDLWARLRVVSADAARAAVSSLILPFTAAATTEAARSRTQMKLMRELWAWRQGNANF